jgi:translation elongation factor P/translation initiation factor 5A
MKTNRMSLLFIILFLSSCNSNKFSINEDVSAIYLTVTPFSVSPISINEINIHFIDESTCSQLRIHGEDINLISDRLKYLKPTKQTEVPKKYEKYIKVWTY